jgi:hypothetical protein
VGMDAQTWHTCLGAHATLTGGWSCAHASSDPDLSGIVDDTCA